MAPTVRDFSPKPSWRNSTFERQPRHQPPYRKSNHHQTHPRFLARGQTLYFSTVLMCQCWSGTTFVCHLATQYCQSHAISLLTSQCHTLLPIYTPLPCEVSQLVRWLIYTQVHVPTGFVKPLVTLLWLFKKCSCGWCNDIVKSICGDSYTIYRTAIVLPCN